MVWAVTRPAAPAQNRSQWRYKLYCFEHPVNVYPPPAHNPRGFIDPLPRVGIFVHGSTKQGTAAQPPEEMTPKARADPDRPRPPPATMARAAQGRWES